MVEDTRRKLTVLTARGSWFAALILTALRVTEQVPQVFGVVIVFLIGVAISTGLALSRHRLTDALLTAFEAGAQATRDHADEIKDEVLHEAEVHAKDSKERDERHG